MATKKETTATKKELAVMHFQTPESLVEWVNKNDVKPLSIVPFDRFQAVYFYKN